MQLSGGARPGERAARAILERDVAQIPDIQADADYALGSLAVIKRLEVLHELLPTTTTMAMLVNPINNPAMEGYSSRRML